MAQNLKSKLKPTLKKAQAKFFSTYYSNPAKDLQVIVVTGANRRNTAQLLRNILHAKDAHVGLVNEPASTSQLYKRLFRIWKAGATYAIITTDLAPLANHLCYGMPVRSIVFTEDADSRQAALAQAAFWNIQPAQTIVDHAAEYYGALMAQPGATAVRSYGNDRAADLRINRSKLYKLGTEANFTHDTDNFDVATYLLGEAAVGQMAAAALAAFELGLNADQIIDGIADYEPKKD